MTRRLRKQLDALNTSVESCETGSVIQVGDGIACVDGSENAMAGELFEFTSSTGQAVYGMAQNLEEDEGRRFAGRCRSTKENDAAGRPPVVWLEVPSGKALLGCNVNLLGMPLDGKGEIKAEAPPGRVQGPGVIQCKPVHEPMQTVVSWPSTPRSRPASQRESIIGDRQTGKTALSLSMPF